MTRRISKTFWTRSLQRNFNSLARSMVRAGTKAVKSAVRSTAGRTPALRPQRALPATRKAKPGSGSGRGAAAGAWLPGLAAAPGGLRRYRLYRPAGVQRTEHLPLLVMLHGCGQNAEELAAISRMNRLADRERFLVLYPEQDRLHNSQGCWNWFETRSGKAQIEAGILEMAIDQVSLTQRVDPGRIGLAGFSAGAGMAALLATRRPSRYRAVVMHSGVPPGVAHSTASALSAMRRGRAATPLPDEAVQGPLPGLLVIQGSADHVVSADNGTAAVELWARVAGATPRQPRRVQRGARRLATITDYRTRAGRLAATLCAVEGLGHAWSGGAAGRSHSDPVGPDASRMIWSFFAKQFGAEGDDA